MLALHRLLNMEKDNPTCSRKCKVTIPMKEGNRKCISRARHSTSSRSSSRDTPTTWEDVKLLPLRSLDISMHLCSSTRMRCFSRGRGMATLATWEDDRALWRRIPVGMYIHLCSRPKLRSRLSTNSNMEDNTRCITMLRLPNIE
jgi:hypothetical protein